MTLKTLLVAGMVATMGLGGVAQAQDTSRNQSVERRVHKLKKVKPFYSGRASKVGVTGDYEYLENIGLAPRLFHNPVKISTTLPCPDDIKNHEYSQEEIEAVLNSLNEENVGNKILTYIYTDKNGNLSEAAVLNERARQNVDRDATERLSESNIDLAIGISEDVLPLISNNYIFLTTKCGNGVCFMAFKADMDKETQNDVYKVYQEGASGSVLSQIEVPVSFVGSGFIKNESEVEAQGLMARKAIAKKVPAMAVRGRVLGRAPLRADFGISTGAKVGDRVEIYRAMINKDGDFVSKRISTARIGAMDDNQAYLFPIAGNKGSRKNGDMAVVVPDKKMSIYFEPTWSPRVWGFDVNWTWQNFVTKYGLTGQLIGNLGFAMTEKPSRTFLPLTDGGVIEAQEAEDLYGVDRADYEQFKSPVFLHLGVGYGVSYTIAGLVEFMPFAMAQYEMGLMINKKIVSLKEEDTNSKNIMGSSIRIPVGLNVFFNLGYKFQIGISGGWAYTYGLDDKNTINQGINYNWTEKNYENYMPVKDACKNINAKRTGVFLGVGLRWRF